MILIFDTETTGLLLPSAAAPKKQPRPIEFFGLFLDEDMEEAGTLSFLFNPDHPNRPNLPGIITKITGLRNADLADAPPFAEKAGEIRAGIARADMVVGHNLTFDRDIVDAAMAHAGKEPVEWPRQVCTVEETEHLCGHRLTLSAIYQRFFDETFTAHRAESDVRATARVFAEGLRRGVIEL